MVIRMEILNDLTYLINLAPMGVVLASLALLVSALSAYNSSRAIRFSQRAEKRSVEFEAKAKQLRTIEKQTEIAKLLNEALMELSQANTLMKLCRVSLPNLLDFYSNNIYSPSRTGYHAELEKTINAIKDIEIKNSNLESDIRKTHEDIGQKLDVFELEKQLGHADVLRKAATMEFKKSQHIYQDLMRGIETLTKITFKRKGIEI